jgi:hypothetical protein
MANPNGELLQRKPLSSYRSNLKAGWLEYVLLVGLGALAVVLHQVLRVGLGLPGRHGIEWMALIIIGRGLSRSRYAGSIASLGAAGFSLLPIWGAADDPFIWLTYLLPGIVMDIAFTWLPGWQGKLLFLVSLGGLAHATKPLTRWLIGLASGLQHTSLLTGLAYPFMTHLLFGAVGGLLGGLIVLGTRKLLANSKS